MFSELQSIHEQLLQERQNHRAALYAHIYTANRWKESGWEQLYKSFGGKMDDQDRDNDASREWRKRQMQAAQVMYRNRRSRRELRKTRKVKTDA